MAIDPDVDKSGYAILEVDSRRYHVTGSATFAELIDLMQTYGDMAKQEGADMEIVVEAGYLNASNWHLANAHNAATAAKIGHSTGRNHETAHKIVEVAREYLLMPTTEVKPLVKMWAGKDRKITHDELTAITTYDKSRSNQDERDACLLAWVFARLPTRIMVI